MTSLSSSSSYLGIRDWARLPDGTILTVGSYTIFHSGSPTMYHFTSVIGEDGAMTPQTTVGSGNYTNTQSSADNFPDVDLAVNDFGGFAVVHSFGVPNPNAPAQHAAQIKFYDHVHQTYVTRILTPNSVSNNVDGVSVVSQTGNTYGVTWAEKNAADGSGYSIMFQRYDMLGNAMGSAVAINRATAGDQTDQTMVDLAAGGFAMAYTSVNGGNGRIRVDLFNDNGGVQAGGGVVSAGAHDAGDSYMVQLNNGNLVVAYEDVTSGGIYYRVLDSSGNALTAVTRVHAAGEASLASELSMTALSNGGFAIAFRHENGLNDRVYFQRFDATGARVGALTEAGAPPLDGYAIDTSIIEAPNGAIVVNGRFYDAASYLSDYIVATTAASWDLYSGNDIFIGMAGDETILGRAGSDNIQGMGGDDFIHGGGSNANLPGPQLLDGGAGNDTIISGQASLIFGGDGHDRIIGGGNSVTGGTAGGGSGDSNDTIHGGTGNDLIYARDGDDWVDGGAGNDIIRSGAGNDTILGGAGNDRIIGDAAQGAAILDGGSGNDTILGSFGSDSIDGGTGADQIEGRAGDDTITGGGNADVFVYRDGSIGNDVILDFANGTDTLRIDSTIAPNFAALNWETNGTDVLLWLGPVAGTDSVLLVNMAGLFDAGDVVFF